MNKNKHQCKTMPKNKAYFRMTTSSRPKWFQWDFEIQNKEGKIVFVKENCSKCNYCDKLLEAEQ